MTRAAARSSGRAAEPAPARTLRLTPPAGFSWRRTLLSHGWALLPPFELDRERWTLTRALDLDGTIVRVTLSQAPDGAIEASGAGASGPRARAAAMQVSRMLGLADRLDGFYDLADGQDGFDWIRRAGAGRMLRTPSVFEDLVKTICTTNCSWSLTQAMTARLVERAGRSVAGRSDAGVTGAAKPAVRAFPRPEDLAGRPEGFFRDEIRSGYRSGSLRRLADDVASGRLDVENWAVTDEPTPALKKRILQVRGVGPYAAENLLRLLGRFDGLALDSWCRREYARRYRRGRAVSDRTISRHYGSFGAWQGLALWCDLTRDWIADGESAGGGSPFGKFTA